ncbi:MAG: DUF4240 domain-containing protein [Bacteroidetes bacterium]|nr:DUF4240 domain-containing protein [Bacteroidota bacterium]
MTTVLNINVDDIDSQFVESLKRDFAHASVEIRLQEQTDAASAFTDAAFWKAIDLLDWTDEGDDLKVVEPLVTFLSGLPISHIYRFSDLLSEKLWHLDTRAHAKVFLDDPDEANILSVDDFLYTRCAVVANGQTYYEKVLKSPDLMPPDLTFEPLLYVAMEAYKRKTGKAFTPEHAYNYETFSNKKGWEK